MVTKYHLGVVDYLVITIVLLIVLFIGIWFRFTGNRLKTTRDYLMAGKDMPKLPVILSTTVTIISSVTMISYPAEVYRFGITILIVPLIAKVGAIISAYVFLPVYFECGVSTVYEFLEIRYGRKIRYTISGLFIVQMVFYMSISLYGPVLALGAVTNLSQELSILIIGIVCTFYCMMGGLKAVLWTDVFQAFLMCTFAIVFYSKSIVEAGGVEQIFRKSSEGQRLNPWNFSPDMTLRYTFWSTCARGLVGGLAYYGTSQLEVQRMLSMRNYERGKSCLLWSIVPTSIFHCLFLGSGLVIYSIFHSCDPIKDVIHSGVKKYDQMIPYYIVTRFGFIPGLTGLCVSGIFSGSLSTISSALNSASTVTVVDFIQPLLSTTQITEKKTVFIAKFFSLSYGIICISLTFALTKADSLVAAATVFLGIVEGPVLGIFLIAVLTRKGSEKCALFGLLIGVVLICWLGFGSIFSGFINPTLPLSTSGCSSQNSSLDMLQNSTILCTRNATCLSTIAPKLQLPSEPFILHKISFNWMSTIGCCVSLLFTLLAALVTGWKNENLTGSKYRSPITQFWSKDDQLEYKSVHRDVIPLQEKL